MTWEEALKYKPRVEEIARTWANKSEPSLYDDCVQETLIKMVETVDLSKARGDELEYVKGCIWNIVSQFFRDERKRAKPMYFLEDLENWEDWYV